MRRHLDYSLLTALLLGLLMTGCTRPTSRWDSAQEGTKDKTAVSKEARPGADFNKFFPKAAGDLDLTFEQEKPGTAIAKLSIDKKEVATLSVFDTISDSKAREKFEGTKEKLADYPLVHQGKNATSILVNNRFQVTVRSLPEADFPKEKREEVIKKFDLDGLAKLN